MDYRPRIAITRWEKVPGEDIAEYHRRVLEAAGALVNSRHHRR